MKFRHLLAFAASAAIILAVSITTAPAADKGGPPARIDAEGNVKSPVSCFGGVSVGATFSAASLGDGSTSIDIGTQAASIGLEVGCDYRVAPLFSIGALGRYDWNNAKASLLGADATVDGIWAVAGKATWHMNTGTDLYGLLGYSGTTFKIEDLSDNRRGVLYGIGLETKIADSPVNLFAEWSRTDFKESDIGGVSLKPSVDVVRIGSRIRF